MHGSGRRFAAPLAEQPGGAHDFTVRIAVAFAAALLAIGAVAAASLRSLSARRDWSRWIVRTQEVRLSIARVSTLATEAESAQGRYLLEGRENYLESSARPKRSWRKRSRNWPRSPATIPVSKSASRRSGRCFRAGHKRCARRSTGTAAGIGPRSFTTRPASPTQGHRRRPARSTGNRRPWPPAFLPVSVHGACRIPLRQS